MIFEKSTKEITEQCSLTEAVANDTLVQVVANHYGSPQKNFDYLKDQIIKLANMGHGPQAIIAILKP